MVLECWAFEMKILCALCQTHQLFTRTFVELALAFIAFLVDKKYWPFAIWLFNSEWCCLFLVPKAILWFLVASANLMNLQQSTTQQKNLICEGIKRG